LIPPIESTATAPAAVSLNFHWLFGAIIASALDPETRVAAKMQVAPARDKTFPNDLNLLVMIFLRLGTFQ
jgi:hypothetical protein